MKTDHTEPSLDDLAADVARAADLGPAERARVQLRCAAILAALAQIPVADQPDSLLDPAGAAERLHMSRSTIYEMMKDGRLRYIEKGERGKLIPESAIQEFIERQARRAGRPTLEAIRARVKATDDRNHP